MGQAYALSTLHLCRKPAETNADGKVIKAPEIEIVPAGKIVDVSDEDFKAFAENGHARRPTREDRARAGAGEEPGPADADPNASVKPPGKPAR